MHWRTAAFAHLINPGPEEAYYEAAVDWLVHASAIVVGFFLFLGAGYLFAKRKPERNAVLFALAIWAGYILIEFISLVAAGSLTSMVGIITLSLGTKLVAVIAGAKLGAVQLSQIGGLLKKLFQPRPTSTSLYCENPVNCAPARMALGFFHA